MILHKMKNAAAEAGAFGERLLVLFRGLKYSYFSEVQSEIYVFNGTCFFEVHLFIEITVLK